MLSILLYVIGGRGALSYLSFRRGILSERDFVQRDFVRGILSLSPMAHLVGLYHCDDDVKA